MLLQQRQIHVPYLFDSHFGTTFLRSWSKGGNVIFTKSKQTLTR